MLPVDYPFPASPVPWVISKLTLIEEFKTGIVKKYYIQTGVEKQFMFYAYNLNDAYKQIQNLGAVLCDDVDNDNFGLWQFIGLNGKKAFWRLKSEYCFDE